MRLTPSRFRSSSGDSSEEGSGGSETTSGVTIYHTPPSDLPERGFEDTKRVESLVPESDTALVSVLDEVGTPTTVDEVTDQVIHPARPSIDTWAGVHERLHQERLPELDESGYIEFDTEQGLVESHISSARTESRFSLAALGRLWVKVLYSLTALVAVVLLIGLVAAFVTTMFDIPVDFSAIYSSY